MNDADSKKLEEIEEKYTIDEGNGPFICIVGAEETNDDMAWLISKVKEQDREIERLNKRLLEISREAGESVHCSPSPIDAFRILKARIAEQDREIKRLNSDLTQMNLDSMEEELRLKVEIERLQRIFKGVCIEAGERQELLEEAEARVKELEDERKECMDSRKEAEKEKV